MIEIAKAMWIAVSLVAGFASASCIQCTGKQVMTFTRPVTDKEASAFFKNSIADCATGNQYNALDVTQLGNTWTVQLKIWRYCGHDASNYVNKGAHCFNNICTSADYRVLTCTKSVTCEGPCEYRYCGG